MAAGESNGRRAPLGRRGLRGRDGVLMIVGWEGQRDSVDRRRLHTMTLLRRGGGTPIGESAGRAWAASRFAAPYVRDELLGRGVLVDQFETASTWSGLEPLRASVDRRDRGGAERVRHAAADRLADLPRLRHRRLADLHRAGAGARRPGGGAVARGQGRRERAIVRAGATISHHHGIGRDHAGWAEAELGALGVSSLRALKAHLDPFGVMNPGKLVAGY